MAAVVGSEDKTNSPTCLSSSAKWKQRNEMFLNIIRDVVGEKLTSFVSIQYSNLEVNK